MLSSEFEVHVQRERRWTIDAIRGDESSAVEHANGLLGDGAVEAVRVIRIRRGWTGREYPTEVFSANADQRATAITVPGAIERAPPCTTIDDLHRLDARLTAGRLFRRYLDKFGVTPSELLHSHRELRRLIDADMLVVGAIGRVAALQTMAAGAGAAAAGTAPGPGGGGPASTPDTRERSKALHALVAELLARAKAAEARRLPSLGDDGLAGLIPRLRGAEGPGGATFAAGFVLTRELVTIRNLHAKLDRLLALAQGVSDPEPLALLDGFAADLLGSGELIRDVLGHHPSLSAALNALLLLLQGRLAPSGPRISDLLVKLDRMFATGRMVECSAVVLDRIRRELQGGTPLVPGSPREQAEAFAELLTALVTPMGLLGGPPMAAAAVARQARLSNQGGPQATRAAIAALGAHFGSAWDELQFLLSLANSELAHSFADRITEQIINALDHLRRVEVLKRRLPVEAERLRLLLEARHRLAQTHLPEVARTAAVRRIDTVITLHASALAGGPVTGGPAVNGGGGTPKAAGAVH